MVIVGGGIAGLAAAYRLATSSVPIDVSLLEASQHLGGKISTEHVHGFVIEAGPDSFLASKARGIGLVRELGLSDRLVGTIPENRKTFIFHRGRLHDLPEGLTGLVPTRLGAIARSSLLTPRAKARLALDYVLPPRKEEGDETIASFIERRLGKEAYERLVEPLMAGIYAGDGRQLSLAATFPQLRHAELAHGGLIKGVLAGKKNSGQPIEATATTNGISPATPFLSLRGGLVELVDEICRQLIERGVKILTDNVATELHREANSGYSLVASRGNRFSADAVVLATPASSTAMLLSGISPNAEAALRSIPHVSTATISLGYRRENVLKTPTGYGYVVPRIEKRPVLASTWVSSKWPNRAPDGFALYRVFVGRAGDRDVLDRDDNALISIARNELRDVLGIDASPVIERVFRWPDGMPQYTLGHLDRVDTIQQALGELPGLYIAGSSYRGVGIPDCVASGEAAADRAVALLRETPVS